MLEAAAALRSTITDGFTRHFRGRTASFLLAGVLFALNAYVCRGLFGIEYLRHMGSIEAAYIGISRYMLAHWRDFTWFPAWYGGIPAQNTYPPLLHWMVAFAAWLRGMSPAHAHHWVTAIFYCLGPVTLFALALRLSGSKRAAFLAGALYSALSPSEWLIPSIGRDTGLWHPERLTALISSGEGPHIAALTVLPLAILFLDLSLEHRRAPYFALAALGFASVALTNWIGAFALALCVLAYVLARPFSPRDLAWVTFIALTAYCLASPSLPPSTIASIETNSKLIGGDYTHTGAQLLQFGPLILAIVLGFRFILRRASGYLKFAVFLSLLTAFLPLMGAWGHIYVVPQPERYHLEMELALALLAGLLLDAVLRRLPARADLIAPILLVLAAVWLVKSDRHYARATLFQTIDITTTSEWRTAHWLNRNWSGGRVMLPGSSAFWLTVFSDASEIGGGFDQGITIPVYHMAKYEIGTGVGAGSRAPEIAILWLKALGVQAVGVSAPGSTEVYKDFRNPQEFEGVLQPLWREGGDVLYNVGASASLAHILTASDLVTRTPINGIDVAPLRPYVNALENRQYPAASFRWTSLHSASIETNLPPKSVVSVQISWSAGWHARTNGRALPLFKDGLGFMYLVPNAAGPASITIDYDGGLEMIAARWISKLTLLLLVLACVIWR